MSSEDARISELRSLVSPYRTPYYDTHFNLLRWIQAYPGESLEKVAHRLRHHLLFRASSWEVDAIHQRKPPHHPIHKYWPMHLSEAIPNRLVIVEQAGSIDYEGIFDNFSVPEIVKAKLSDAEEVLAAFNRIEKETGKQAWVMLVIDIEGVEYSKKLIDMMLGPMNSRTEFMLQHYVELVDKVVIVNAPSWAHTLCMMIKPLLPERSREKLRILSSSNWREEICSMLDPSISPISWDSDFKCQQERPPRVPRMEIAKPLEILNKLHVKAGRVRWLEFILHKGDTLTFHVTGDSSFGFGVFCVETENETDVSLMPTAFPLFPWIHGPLKVPIVDSVVAAEDGLYKVWFSNSRAWWFSVTIRYGFSVVSKISTN